MNNREAFEAWYQNGYVQFGRANFHFNSYGEYFDDDIEASWCAWQAALASQAQQTTELSDKCKVAASCLTYNDTEKEAVAKHLLLEASQQLRRVQAQQESQWISVEERLPETYIADDRELIVLGKHIGASIKSDDVLVLLKTGRVKMDRLAGIAGNEPFWWIYRNLVVSWMPLPPAPEGDTNG